jgi:hypothetical protein
MRGCILAAALVAASFAATTALAATAEDKCEAGKNLMAGKYALCVQAAAKSFVLSGDAARYAEVVAKCQGKYGLNWDKLEAGAVKAGSQCPDAGDPEPVLNFLDACSESVAAALGGEDLPADPITCNAGLATCEDERSACDGERATCETSLGGCEGELSSCEEELTTCEEGTCPGDLAACNAALGACQAEPPARPLKTGQTICYATNGSVIDCAGTSQDAETQKGVARSFTDNGDGTVTDNQTGLMWEKISMDGSIHDRSTSYTWATAVTTKIATLNSTSFAGYSDWRLPNRFELETLVNLGAVNPATYSAFNTACDFGCTVESCSCTRLYSYWSSSTYQNGTSNAWYVYFADGENSTGPKTGTLPVRAVRAGS